MKIRKILLGLCFLMPVMGMGQTSDAERLGMALEYFQSAKYHEALLIFQKLDAQYRLNPRYMAFIGVCYYYEWNYPEAIKYLDGSIPQLSNFAPHERSFYYWANAESHFNLKKYKDAVPLYEEMLNLCYDNEKPDAWYRLGMCQMFLGEWHQAIDYYKKALDGYQMYRDVSDNKARIAQIQHMIKGCEDHVAIPVDRIDIVLTPKPAPTVTISSVPDLKIKPEVANPQYERPIETQPEAEEKVEKEVVKMTGDTHAIDLNDIYNKDVEVKP